jgi:signal transduction histidine kinase
MLAERGRKLSEEVEARVAQLRELSRFLEQVREEEKQRVARELHDELGGTLTAAKIDLQLIGDRVQSDAAISTRIGRIHAALDDAIAVKRRIIEDLRPTLLDNLGIGAALRWQCDQFTKRTGCVCETALVERELQLSPDLSIAVYRIVQEALTNVAKYAKAKSVEVELRREGDRWHLRVHDDGVGLDLAKQHHPTSHGLISIRERVRALGGELRISGGPGLGTTIEAGGPGDAGAKRGLGPKVPGWSSRPRLRSQLSRQPVCKNVKKRSARERYPEAARPYRNRHGSSYRDIDHASSRLRRVDPWSG